jgi:hypothetical protein
MRSNTILWQQVWGLTALLGAIVFSFSIYGIYQPKILAELGLPQLSLWFGIFQALLGTILEPSFGYLSDRCLRRLGSRLPQITAGVTVAGLIFLLVAIASGEALFTGFPVLVALLMTLWVVAMIAVRGPMVALLQQFAPTEKLPTANLMLVTVLGLIGALSPLLEGFLQRSGMAIAFTLGALALLIGSLVFYRRIPRHELFLPLVKPYLGSGVGIQLFSIGVGVGVTLALSRSLLEMSPLPLAKGSLLSLLLAIAALSAWPLRGITRRMGARKALRSGLGAIALLSLAAAMTRNSSLSLLLLVAIGLALGLIFDAMIPWVLSLSPEAAGLGTGLYFGGYGLGNSLLDIFKRFSLNFSPQLLLVIFAVLLILALSSLEKFPRFRPFVDR